MAVQRAADDDPGRAFALCERWATDPDPLVRRAAVAAVCEPRLLRDPAFARRALVILDGITSGVARSPAEHRRLPSNRTLRQAIGYGWSVVVAALPNEGMEAFGRWGSDPDPDIIWIVRENLKKNRLKRVLHR